MEVQKDLPKTFLYPIEFLEWQEAKNSNDFMNLIHTGMDILKYNPYNKEVREFILFEVLNKNPKFIKGGVLAEKYNGNTSVASYLKTAESILKNCRLSASEMCDISTSSKNIRFRNILESFIDF